MTTRTNCRHGADRLWLFLAAAALLAAAGCSSEGRAPEREPIIGSVQLALTPGCGNGVVEPELGEICDDGNSSPFDGCSPSCTIEQGYVCVGERPSVCSAPDRSDGPGAYGAAQHSRALPPVSPFTGRDFWTGFPYNVGAPTALALKIAGDPGTAGLVRNTAGATISSFTIGATGVATIDLTIATYHITAYNTVGSQGVHVTADNEIRVLATNEMTYSTDTWALWSSDKLGDAYTVLDLGGGTHQLLFVAAKDATAITIKDASGAQVASFTLNAGQTYLYQNAGAVLAGYTVESSNPVAVLAGTSCTNLPGTACDMIAEQLAPTRNWARDYVVGPTFNSTTAKSLHAVFAAYDQTAVVITRSDGTLQNLTLNKGQSNTFADTSAAGDLAYFVSADKPIAVASVVSDPGGAGVWDPALVFWPPIDGYVAQAKMPTSGRNVVYTNFLTLITRSSATAYLRVNGLAVSGWKPIASTGYSFTQVAVPEGDNEIEATDGVKFGAVAAGGANYVSYAYASPYDIAAVGGTTNCYLGSAIPDYEAVLATGPNADADDLDGVDDEDALTGTLSVKLGDAAPQVTVPCNDNYFGVDSGATVHGFIDFDRDGAFGPGEHASAACDDPSATLDGSATLTWSSPVYGTVGNTIVRLRICDGTDDCSAPAGAVDSGEAEDHVVHVGVCGDGYVDSFDGCDDGDLDAGDGCSPTCTVEPGFSCSGNPSVCLITDSPAITTPVSGTLTNDSTPTVSGTCHTGAQVRVLEGASVLCTATCASGAFSCTSSTLSDGAHLLRADQSFNGFTSVPGPQVTLNIDTTIPNPPAISSPASGAVINTSTPTVSGSCEPGAVVRVLNGATQLCSATCGADRTFFCKTSALAQGSVTLTATQTDVGGKTSVASAGVTITIDTTAPAVPTISAPAQGATTNDATPTVSGACEAGATVRVYEGLSLLCTAACNAGSFSCDTVALANGSHSIAARQTDPAGNTSAFSALRAFTVNAPPIKPTITAPTEGALVSTTVISVSCQNGNTVKVFEGSTELCSGACPVSTYTCMPALSQGAHTVFARQIDPTAQVSPDSDPRSFTVDTLAPAAPGLSAPAQGSSSTDPTPTFSGSCESGATVRVFEGSDLLCSAVCAAGSFGCTSGALADGNHTVVVNQVDPAGNVSADAAARTFSIDNTPPAAPTIAAPAAGATTGKQPVVSGACESGATVVVREGATTLCTATCVASAYSCATSALIDGAHSLVARQTDAAGNVGPDSAARSFTVDATPPAAPVVSAPAAGASLADTTPTVSGTCETGATVQVREGATVLCSATCAAGAFTCDTSALGQGAHTVSARQTDAAGNVSADSAARAFTVDTVAPAAPAITGPAAGAFVADTTPTITGTCETGATVQVREGATVLCSATCAAGAFSCDASVLGQGSHSLVTRQTDAAGNASADSAARAFTVDTVAPAAPAISSPAANAAIADTTPRISGTCETGTTVQVREGATVLCSATCAAGAFGCDTSALSQGAHSVVARQTDAAGNASADSAARAFTVDTVAPSAPIVSGPAAGAFLADTTPTVSGTCETGATVQVREGAAVLCSATCAAGAFSCDTSALGQGAHSVVVRQTDAAGNVSADSAARSFTVDTVAPAAPAIAAPAAGAFLSDSTPAISGSCETGATVEVREGATVLCSASCAAGAFSCDASALVDGSHAVTARQTDAAGNVGADSAARSFTVDTVAPTAPVVAAPAAGAFVADATPTVAGSCESGTKVEVLEGATVLCSATCTSGAFGCDSSALAEGAHSVFARQTDAAGNVSADGAARGFTVDTIAPDAPAIGAPAADAFLSDSTPTVSGNCEDGAAVQVVEGAAVLCTATCSSGAFSCDASALGEGSHTLTARQTDTAGNVSANASALTFTVDTVAPSAPSIAAPAEGEHVADSTPTVSGGCESGATVEVLDREDVVCTATCASGAFTCETSTLVDGSHALAVRQTDAAGNVSASSAPRNVVVDTVAPDAPAISDPVAGVDLSDSTPVVFGTCESNATVEVLEGATVLCTATCVSGSFGCSSSALGEGSHDVFVRQTDEAGNVSVDGAPISFTVDTIAPEAPAVSAPAAGDFVSDATPTVSGTCEDGARIELLEGATVLCSATCADGAFSCTASVLAEGEHPVTARQTDAAGNVSADATPVSFTVDVTAPEAPVLSAPAADAQLADSTPTVSGSCESGTSVEVLEGATVLCTATCTDGLFSCDSSALADGTHALEARQTDAAGNVSSAAAAVSFTVDTTAPDAPTPGAPAAGEHVATATPSIEGGCEDGATVTVREGADVLCTALCASGAFSCDTTALADGEHTVVVEQTDLAGNTSSGSGALTFVVDTVAPEAPSITLPADGLVTNEVEPQVSGTCESGATVEVLDGATVLCSALCVDGLFSCTSAALDEGSHGLTARQTDEAGNTGSAGGAVAVLVDVTAPATPTVEAPAAGSALSDSTPEVRGGCESGAAVAVYEGGVLLCSVECVDDAFACETSALPEGEHAFEVVQTDPAGNASSASTAQQFVVDTIAPEAPAITSPADGMAVNDETPIVSGSCESGSTVEVLEGATVLCTASCVDGAFSCEASGLSDGDHTLGARQTDAAGNVSESAVEIGVEIDTAAPDAPVISGPAAGEVIADSNPTITGSCEDGSQVEVREGTTVLCNVACTAGEFSCTTSTLADGDHTLVVEQTDPAGNPSTPTELQVGIDTVVPDAPAISAPADGSASADATPTVSGSCESGATVEVREGETVLCTASCVDSAFSCETSELSDGSHAITTTQTDLGGNVSVDSGTVTVEIDTTAPVVPTLDTPAGDELVADEHPDFGGTGEAGSTVTVTVDGEEACTAVVAADGTWSCQATDPVGDGDHAIQVSAEDPLGNGSEAGDVVSITVDTHAPGIPSLLNPTEGQLVGAWPSFSGLADPGANVEVRVDDAAVCAAAADGQGAFACVARSALEAGGHQATATAYDDAGNRSAPSAAVGFTVGAGVAPGAPVVSEPASDQAIGDSTPTFAGQAEPGSTVEITVDGVAVCTATAEEAGEFECASTVSLPDGEHVVTATASNSDGTSQPSGELHFSVDATAPAAPAIESPAEGGTVGLTPLFEGSAEAGATVAVSVDGAVVCTAIAGDDGHFGCRADAALTAGQHTASAVATDAAGNASEASAPVDFEAAATAAPTARIRVPSAGAVLASQTVVVIGSADAGSTVRVRIDGASACEATASAAGTWSCTASVADGEHAAVATASNDQGTGEPSPEVRFAVDTAVPQAPVLLTPEDGATTNAWPRFSGTAEEMSIVRVLVDGRALCVAQAANDGAFECVGPVPLAAGAHSASAVSLDAGGNTSASSAAASFTVSVDAPAITAPAAGALTNDATPEFTGTAEPGDAVSVLVDGAAVCESVADEQGGWSCTPEEAIADGTHAVKAVATDGFASVQFTDEQSLSIDTVAPGSPAFTEPQAGTTILGGQTTLGGTAEPGSVVSVAVDGEEVCRAIAGDDGRWHCTVDLGDGEHEAEATATDKAGNESDPAAPLRFANDTELAPPAIVTPENGATLDGPSVAIAGTAVPLTTVTVTDDLGNTLCEVAADELGSFACSAQVAAGERTIRAVSTWNVMSSQASEPVSFTVLVDMGFVGGGVGCGCSSSGGASWVWAVALLAVAALRRRRPAVRVEVRRR